MRNDIKKFQSQYYRLQTLKDRLLSIEKHLSATDRVIESVGIHSDVITIVDYIEYISSTHAPLSREQMQFANLKWNSIKQKYPNIK